MNRRQFLATTAGAATALALSRTLPAGAFPAGPRTPPTRKRTTMTAPTPPAGLARYTLTSGRTYLAPITPPAALTAPVVLGLHMTAHDAVHLNDTMWVTGNPATTGWSRKAAADGYHLLLAEGISGKWNVGAGWPGGSQDDVAYLNDVLINYALRIGPGGGPRIAIGVSAGGAMAWKMAVASPDLVDACVSISGWAPSYPTTVPITAWHFHGADDTTVPYLGGAGVYGYVFPAAGLEQSRVPRGSLVAHEYRAGYGHGAPGWAAGAAMDAIKALLAKPLTGADGTVYTAGGWPL